MSLADTDSPFVPAALALPLRLGRVSSAGTPDKRIIMILYDGAENRPVFYAESTYRNLEDAIENLRKREGCRTAAAIGYVNLSATDVRDRVKSKIIEVGRKVEDWARRTGYNAAIWTDLSASGVEFREGSNGEEILPLLRQDPVLLANTKKYIRNLVYTWPLLDQVFEIGEAPRTPAASQRQLLPPPAPQPREQPREEIPLPPTSPAPSLFQRFFPGLAVALSVWIVYLVAKNFFPWENLRKAWQPA